MRVGDKVYCYKDNFDGTFDYNYKGKWYTIITISKNSFLGEIGIDNYYLVLTVNKNVPLKTYNLNISDYNRYDFDDFDSYFMTLKQMRKLKLKKIEKINEL